MAKIFDPRSLSKNSALQPSPTTDAPKPNNVEFRPLVSFEEAKTLGEEEFVRLYPTPVLLVQTMRDDADSQHTTSTGNVETSASVRVQVLDLARLSRQELQSVRAYVLRKERTRFGEAIWIGRWSKCDIAIELSTLSRLHAFITYDNEGAPFLGDGGSKNGTYVDGKQVTKGATVPLPEAAFVTLGTLGVRFLQPAALFRELQDVFRRLA
jgi:hypothetical protein